MKSIIKYLGVAAGVGLLLSGATSCKEEFLETDHYDVVDLNALYSNDANAIKGMSGIYDMMFPQDETDGDWGFKPNLFVGCHPTMDTQATGWDIAWCNQAWSGSSTELNGGWLHAYAAITRCNDYLAGLEKVEPSLSASTGVTENTKNTLIGEAKAMRAFWYSWLAQNFRRVPLLKAGETYNNTATKARAASDDEMWNFIIEDLNVAVENLDWVPFQKEAGRCTKGMALAYRADAYMWLAYWKNDKSYYEKAKADLKEILEKGPYKLNKSFATLWDPQSAWGPECIWAEVLDEGSNWNGWSDFTAKFNLKWYVACPENGGWGSLYLSWEWYSCYEHGDKRRDGSCCTGAVPEEDLQKYGIEKSDNVWGWNPYTQEVLGKTDGTTATKQLHFNNGEWAPAIWTTKLWRASSADINSWGMGMWIPSIIYWKRLPNVMLDYAECCFNTGDEATGWDMINQLRERAFGNLEVGAEAEYAKNTAYYNQLAKFYTGSDAAKDYFKGHALFKDDRGYPIPFNTAKVTVPDAKEYYTQLKAKKGFESEVWKVAVNEERRKEFNCEWSLCPDMHRSGYLGDHINHNYPKDATKGDALKDYPWTPRSYDYSEDKMVMPIPSDELVKNPACDQNPGY